MPDRWQLEAMIKTASPQESAAVASVEPRRTWSSVGVCRAPEYRETMETEENEGGGFRTLSVTVAWVVGIWIAIRVWRHLDRLRYFARRNLPHKRPVPILGNMWPVVTKNLSFSEFALAIYNEFPKVKYFGVFEFGSPVYVLRDPELVKTVTVKCFDHFPDHRSLIDESVDPLMGGNIFSMRGERWKEMRSIVSPVFTSSKMRGMFDLIAKCAENFVNHATKQGKPVTLELKDAFTRYTNDVIATTAFGVSVDSLEEPENEFYKMGRAATNFEGIQAMKFFVLSWAPELMKLLKIGVVPSKVRKFFCNLVEDTVETRRRENITRPDLINLLMQAKYKNTDERLSNLEITSQSFIFFFAGFDTSSTLMCFASHMLAVHSDIQERLIAEIDSAYEKTNGALTYEAINELSYLEMVLNETLRYYPPGSLTDREVVRDFELPPTDGSSKPILLRPGDRVWIPIYGLHHDPQYFPNPEKFDPERFAPENKGNVHPFAFVPFGTGPRSCPGNRFALLEAKLVLSKILRKFRIKRCEKTRVPLVLNKTSPTMGSEHGFWLTLEPREDNS